MPTTPTAIPLITLPARCFGPLGVTLPGPAAAETNESHAGDRALPIVPTRWMDERQACARAHGYSVGQQEDVPHVFVEF